MNPRLVRVVVSLILNTSLALDLPLLLRIATFCTILYMSLISATQKHALNLFQAYGAGNSLGLPLMEAYDLLFLADPLRKWQRKGYDHTIREEPFVYRWFWMAVAMRTPRGIGWNFMVKNVPKSVETSRGTFILGCICKVAKYLLLLDLWNLWLRYNPVFSTRASIASQGYIFRCINILAVYHFYAQVNALYYALAALTVLIGIYEPSSWPSLYGQFRDAYTVRSFWGRTWHQLLRRWISSFGQHAARSLGFEQGTMGSAYIQLYVGFFVSGIAHTFGDMLVGRSVVGASLIFFMRQAIAITFEDVIVAQARKTGIRESPLSRIIGYIWVWWWFSYCNVPLIDTGISNAGGASYLPMDPTKIEIIGGALGWDMKALMEMFFDRVGRF